MVFKAPTVAGIRRKNSEAGFKMMQHPNKRKKVMGAGNVVMADMKRTKSFNEAPMALSFENMFVQN